VSIQSRHPELDSGSIHRGNEGSPLTPPLSRRAREKRAAFTLAEVLITLAIIGVVAAMTIPTLISDYQEKVTVTKMKKMYSTLKNAYALYLVDHSPQKFPYTADGATQAFEIFKPYLKIAKDCGTASGDGCLYTGTYFTKNGNVAGIYANASQHYKFLLADGSSLMIRGDSSENTNLQMAIFYDVNGPAGPNKWGHDLFQFAVYNDGVSIEGGSGFEGNCAPSDGAGYNCAWWVITKGNLDYLKCPGELTANDSKCPN